MEITVSILILIAQVVTILLLLLLRFQPTANGGEDENQPLAKRLLLPSGQVYTIDTNGQRKSVTVNDDEALYEREKEKA